MDFDYTELAQSVIASWSGDPAKRTVVGIVGAWLLVRMAVRLARRERLSLIPCLFSAAIAAACLGLALYPEGMLTSLMQVAYPTRLRIIMGAASSVVLVVTLESVRRERLRERYALLWLATGLVILAIVIFPEILAFFRAVTGMKYWSALATVAFIFLTLLAFHFSLTISRLHTHTTKLAQRLAILERQLRLVSRQPTDETKPAPPAEPEGPRGTDAP